MAEMPPSEAPSSARPTAKPLTFSYALLFAATAFLAAALFALETAEVGRKMVEGVWGSSQQWLANSYLDAYRFWPSHILRLSLAAPLGTSAVAIAVALGLKFGLPRSRICRQRQRALVVVVAGAYLIVAALILYSWAAMLLGPLG